MGQGWPEHQLAFWNVWPGCWCPGGLLGWLCAVFPDPLALQGLAWAPDRLVRLETANREHRSRGRPALVSCGQRCWVHSSPTLFLGLSLPTGEPGRHSSSTRVCRGDRLCIGAQ